MKLTMLTKPACNRAVYRSVRKRQIQSIVELGVGDACRAKNMIRVAQAFCGSARVRYTGVDLFEGRPEGTPKIALIDAHRDLNLLKAKTQLVPGAPHIAISRIANSHIRTDLIVISGDQDKESVERCWFYIPRMLHSNSLVLLQEPGDVTGAFKELSRLEIERLANQQQKTSVPVAA